LVWRRHLEPAAVRGDAGHLLTAEVLVGLLEGPYAEQARRALIEISRLPADTDWRAWLENPLFRLPEGT